MFLPAVEIVAFSSLYGLLNARVLRSTVSPRWRPPSRIGFEREMVCSLIRKQMSKRDDGYGSVRSRAATAVDHCREVSDRGESLAPGASVVGVARPHDVHRNLITAWRRQARTGVLAFDPGPMQRQADEARFAAVSIAPDQQPSTAPFGTLRSKPGSQSSRS